MAKSSVRKSPPVSKKKIDALIKRIEALENQSFAQQLLIDELEGKLEHATAEIKDVREFPFGRMTTTPVPSTPSPYPTYPYPYQTSSHVCSPGSTDMFGSQTCYICGQLLTYGLPTYGDSTYSIDTVTDSIEITWDDTQQSFDLKKEK